ncbi:MAG: hypothetical protein WCZ23_05170 [Rhodospirillaceae bacterium]
MARVCYAALWRPSYLIGLELGFSVANAAVAVAKRALKPGDVMDGGGGTTVWRPATR